ncbi:MAG: cell wall-active antibiotics response protein [bacterium]|nr:cell wall-active antibiotics response protein [bacterium]
MRHRSSITPRLIIGLVVIAIGVLFTLDHLELVDADEIENYWPAILILFGVAKLFSDAPASGVFWILVGTLLLVPMFTEELETEDLWPYLLILFGLHLVRRAIFGGPRKRPRPEESPDTVQALGFLSTIKRANSCQEFRGGDLTAIMGACEFDLRKARIADTGAVIDALAFWGGIELEVPESWSVDLRVLPLMGGADDKTRAPRGETGQQLIIRGFVLMGGIEVKN